MFLTGDVSHDDPIPSYAQSSNIFLTVANEDREWLRSVQETQRKKAPSKWGL